MSIFPGYLTQVPLVILHASSPICGVDHPHVFHSAIIPPPPELRCNCGNTTWEQAHQQAVEKVLRDELNNIVDRRDICSALARGQHSPDLE
jgi:hypothetical protein